MTDHFLKIAIPHCRNQFGLMAKTTDNLCGNVTTRAHVVEVNAQPTRARSTLQWPSVSDKAS